MDEDIWQILIRPDYKAEAQFCPKGNLKKCDSKISG